MSRKVFVLTKCDGSPQRVVGNKEWADFILEDDLEVCGVKDHQHQIVELELEYDSPNENDFSEGQLILLNQLRESRAHEERIIEIITDVSLTHAIEIDDKEVTRVLEAFLREVSSS